MRQILLLCFSMIFLMSFSQVKILGGEVYFKNTVKSYVQNVDDIDWQRFLSTSDLEIIYCNADFLMEKNDFYTKYINLKKKSSLTNFRGVDTLFTEFSGLAQTDSAILNQISKLEYDDVLSYFTTKVIPLDTLYLGYKCNKVIYEGFDYISTKIILDSNIYINGSAIALFQCDSNSFYKTENVAFSIIPKNLSNDFFATNNLPIVKYNPKSIYQESNFKKGKEDWIRYLQKNLKSELGNKYLILPKDKEFVKATVIAEFVVNKYGKIDYVKAKNAAFVHPKFVEEAIRVITKSNGWKPAIYNGNPIPFVYRQNLTFVLNKD